MFEYYNNYLSNESDIFAHVDGMSGEDAEINNLRDELGRKFHFHVGRVRQP